MVNGLMIGIIVIVLLLILIFLNVPIGMSFIVSGLIGTWLILGLDKSLSLLMNTAFSSIAKPSWTAIPLFILLGSLAVQSGLASKSYKSADAISSGLPGSVGIATTFANAAFGAVSGSSLAAVSVFGKTAMPEMRKLGYRKTFAAGIIASAGTFASMIPPSMMLIIYALFTNTSISDLFFAGLIPGILNAVLFAVYIYFVAKRNEEIKSKSTKGISLKERVNAMFSAWPVLLIAVTILGGIYTGLFTPTESAAVACIIVLLLGFFQGNFTKLNHLTDSLKESASTTSMIFLINIGALFFAKVLVLTKLPQDLTRFLTGLDVAPIVIVILVCVLYFILGMIMVPIGIYAMTLPIIAPILTSLGYDLVWFGIVSMLLMEIGAITPPVGLNVYALKGVVPKDVTITDIFKGVWAFVIIDLVLLIILIAFPQISLWLPSLLQK